jgi:hypothetical protein
MKIPHLPGGLLQGMEKPHSDNEDFTRLGSVIAFSPQTT